MINVGLFKDERYPDYGYIKGATSYGLTQKSVSEDTFARWERISKEYEDMQDEIEGLME